MLTFWKLLSNFVKNLKIPDINSSDFLGDGISHSTLIVTVKFRNHVSKIMFLIAETQLCFLLQEYLLMTLLEKLKEIEPKQDAQGTKFLLPYLHRVLTYLMNTQVSFLKHTLKVPFKISGNLVTTQQFLKKDIEDQNVTANLLVIFLLSVKYFKSDGSIFICCVVLQKSAVLSRLLDMLERWNVQWTTAKFLS